MRHSVDGWNLAPPGVYEALKVLGLASYKPRRDFSHQRYTTHKRISHCAGEWGSSLRLEEKTKKLGIPKNIHNNYHIQIISCQSNMVIGFSATHPQKMLIHLQRAIGSHQEAWLSVARCCYAMIFWGKEDLRIALHQENSFPSSISQSRSQYQEVGLFIETWFDATTSTSLETIVGFDGLGFSFLEGNHNNQPNLFNSGLMRHSTTLVAHTKLTVRYQRMHSIQNRKWMTRIYRHAPVILTESQSSMYRIRSSYPLLRLHSRKLTWVPKMMVWKRYKWILWVSNGIYVRFLQCNIFKHHQENLGNKQLISFIFQHLRLAPAPLPHSCLGAFCQITPVTPHNDQARSFEMKVFVPSIRREKYGARQVVRL